jgi:hypothetical protein
MLAVLNRLTAKVTSIEIIQQQIHPIGNVCEEETTPAVVAEPPNASEMAELSDEVLNK